MIVTCLYDIGQPEDRLIELRYLFEDMASYGMSITVCTEPSLVSLFSHVPPSVRILSLPKECLELYTLATSYTGELPIHRHASKDTKEYLALLHAKIECLYRVSDVVEDDTFVWIDMGILKHIRNKSGFLERLARIHTASFDSIVLPGWSETGRAFSTDSITSRFFGCFGVFPRTYLPTFYQHCKTVLTDFCTQSIYKLCWETNAWYVVEMCAMHDQIQRYVCDQDDSLLLSFPYSCIRHTSP